MTHPIPEALQGRVALTLLLLFLIAAHLPILPLPFFWDEAGQFVPAALDLQRTGAWIPQTAVPNAHPPMLMAFLAAVWSLCGYSVWVTRAAMLLLAVLAVVTVYLLTLTLSPKRGRLSALFPALLLCVSPLFFGQAVMAQLDMPAMLMTVVALLCFLRERFAACVVACTLLVLVKETGIVVPFIFGVWLASERRYGTASYFLIPLLALMGWFAILKATTGHLFGSASFTSYNLRFPLHPARILLAAGRRIYTLFASDFLWVGTLALLFAWRKKGIPEDRSWRVVVWLIVAHLLLFSLLGGAVLDRYLLPVLPLVYVAMSAALSTLTSAWRSSSRIALVVGLLVGIFWNPPYSYPYENNLGFVDFVKLHQSAARFLEQDYPSRTITTAWPLSVELSNPDLGYVSRGLKVRELPDFTSATMNSVRTEEVEVFAFYSRTWNPTWKPLCDSLLSAVWRRYYGSSRQPSSAEVRTQLGVRRVARWTRRGQWIEIYVR